MITAEIIIGKVVELIVGKSLSAIGKLSTNDRRKACRSLTKLYYSLQALEEVTEAIFRDIGTFDSTQPRAAFSVITALTNHKQEIELASNMFIDLSHELYAGLKIIDPALATCCETLYASKFDFLNEMSEAVTWDETSTPDQLIIKMPTKTTTKDLLSSNYTKASIAINNGDKYYWPDNWIDTDEPSQVILSWEDHDSAIAFVSKLSEHREALISAKQRLRELLKTSFNIEELLFQTDSHPYR